MFHANHTHRTVRRVALLCTLAAPVLLVACGDDDDDADAPKNVTVTAIDYAYKDLPSTLPVGSKLSIKNASTAEMHELVVFRIPDTEKRPMSELMTLPEEELGPIFAGEPATVILAPPGGAQINAVGDGTITEAGRYAVVCAIPEGADPAEYLAAAQANPNEAPQVDGGPPHFVKGMFAEVKVG